LTPSEEVKEGVAAGTGAESQAKKKKVPLYFELNPS
jgi:hypothetical protein